MIHVIEYIKANWKIGDTFTCHEVTDKMNSDGITVSYNVVNRAVRCYSDWWGDFKIIGQSISSHGGRTYIWERLI